MKLLNSNHFFIPAVFYEQKKYDECVKQCEEAIEVGKSNRADCKLIAKYVGYYVNFDRFLLVFDSLPKQISLCCCVGKMCRVSAGVVLRISHCFTLYCESEYHVISKPPKIRVLMVFTHRRIPSSW